MHGQVAIQVSFGLCDYRRRDDPIDDNEILEMFKSDDRVVESTPVKVNNAEEAGELSVKTVRSDGSVNHTYDDVNEVETWSIEDLGKCVGSLVGGIQGVDGHQKLQYEDAASCLDNSSN